MLRGPTLGAALLAFATEPLIRVFCWEAAVVAAFEARSIGLDRRRHPKLLEKPWEAARGETRQVRAARLGMALAPLLALVVALWMAAAAGSREAPAKRS